MEPEFVVDVGESDFEAKVIEGSRERPVIVDFWAAWCQPCLVLSPVLERLADEHGGRFLLVRVDVDANPELSTRFGIQGIPAVKAFREGQVVSEFVGAQPEAVIRRFLDELLPSEAEPLLSEAMLAERMGDRELAETAYRKALAADPDHSGAVIGLARLLLRRDEGLEEVRSLVAPFAHEDATRPIVAELALRDAGAGVDGQESPLAVAAREAVEGEPEAALDRLLAVVAAGGEDREAARELMVRVFDMLGDEDPVVAAYRPRLAQALF